MTDIEQLLHKSGVGYGQSLRESLPRLDRYLAFLPGTRVLDADRGPGRVKKLDLLLDKVTVDFDRGAELELRPVFEADDFGDRLTPELRAQEERQRAEIAGRTGGGRP